MTTGQDPSHDEIVAELLKDSEEIFSSPAVQAVAHMRTPNSGAYVQNDVLLANFMHVMEDWETRQPMVARDCHAR